MCVIAAPRIRIAWLGQCRHLAKDFEATVASATAWILLAHIRLLTKKASFEKRVDNGRIVPLREDRFHPSLCLTEETIAPSRPAALPC